MPPAASQLGVPAVFPSSLKQQLGSFPSLHKEKTRRRHQPLCLHYHIVSTGAKRTMARSENQCPLAADTLFSWVPVFIIQSAHREMLSLLWGAESLPAYISQTISRGTWDFY